MCKNIEHERVKESIFLKLILPAQHHFEKNFFPIEYRIRLNAHIHTRTHIHTYIHEKLAYISLTSTKQI